MLLKIFLFLSIPIAVGLVYLVKVKFNDNQRKYLKWSLWVFIGLFSYLTISSISDVIKFELKFRLRYDILCIILIVSNNNSILSSLIFCYSKSNSNSEKILFDITELLKLG